jgi:SAM-dependent methyltransferase
MSCPLCNSPDVFPVLHNNDVVIQHTFGVPILECPDCQFVFADFIYPQVIEYFYTHLCRRDIPADEIKKMRGKAKENAQSQLDTIKPYLPPKIKRVLDFGGGSGEAARLYLPIADEVYINESDPRSIEHIKEEPRLNLLDGDQLMNDEFVGFFDLIIFSNVLEHMTYPVRRLLEFSRMLAPDGLLFVEIPNEAPLIKKTGVHTIQHITFFTVDTFEDLVGRQSSFDIEDLRTCGAPLADVIEAGKIIHAFDQLETPDGWVIRSLLKNARPQIDIPNIELNPQECYKALANLSDYALGLAKLNE